MNFSFKEIQILYDMFLTIVREKYAKNCNLIFIQDGIDKNNEIDYEINWRSKLLLILFKDNSS